MRDEFDCPPLGSGWLRESGYGGVFLVMSTAWQRVATGGGGTVGVFLVMSTAWQRVATGERLREGGYAGGYGRAVRVGERRANAEGCFLWLDQQDVGDV
jgi:hypothetical protein